MRYWQPHDRRHRARGGPLYLLGERNGFYVIRLVSGRDRFIEPSCCERTRFSVDVYTDTSNWRAYHIQSARRLATTVNGLAGGDPNMSGCLVK